MTVSRLAALCVWCAALAGCAGPRDEIAAIVCAPAPPNAKATVADLGLLRVALPPGYQPKDVYSPPHGSVSISSQDRWMGLTNFGNGESHDALDAECKFDVDGIPVEVFVLVGDPHEPPGTIQVSALLGFPPDTRMQVLLSAGIKSGDSRHASDYRDVLRSIRRGNPRDFVHLPGVKSEYLRDE